MNTQSEDNRIEASKTLKGYSKATIDSDKVLSDKETTLEGPCMVLVDKYDYAEFWELYIINNQSVFIRSFKLNRLQRLIKIRMSKSKCLLIHLSYSRNLLNHLV